MSLLPGSLTDDPVERAVMVFAVAGILHLESEVLQTVNSELPTQKDVPMRSDGLTRRHFP